ncbi:MAG: GFA family protein, partial [Rhodospirillales bacterium]|nr:GFA family protein [Acetobacter sp.]
MTGRPRLLSGACLCGRMAYEVADAFEYAMNCHCSQCRRATGSAFKPFAGIRAELLSLRRGG